MRFVAPRGCRGRRLCAACGVAGAVVVPRVVSRSRPLRRVGVAVAVFAPRGCRSHRLCAACGVAVAVVAPRVVSRSRSLCRVGVAVAVAAPRVVSRVPSLCRVWFRGGGGWPWKERTAARPSAREVVRAR